MKTLTHLLTSLILTPIYAWELMLAVGIAHLQWWPKVPTIGFWTALWISFLMFSMISGGSLTTIMYADKKR